MLGLKLPMPSLPTLPLPGRSPASRPPADVVVLDHDQVEELGRELDALRARITADLGAQDRDYLFRVIKVQRGAEVAGRVLMHLGCFRRRGWPAWAHSGFRRFSTTWRSGTTCCTVSTTGCASLA